MGAGDEVVVAYAATLSRWPKLQRITDGYHSAVVLNRVLLHLLSSNRLVRRLRIMVAFRKLLSSLDCHSIQFKTVPKDYYETCWELPQWTFCARAS